MKTFLAIFLTMTVLLACKSSETNVQLEGVKWVIEKMNDVKISREEGKDIFIQFDKESGKINGKAACNRYFGDYEMNGEQIKFSQLGVTKMACLHANKEAEFLKVLDEANQFQVKDNKLLLLKGKTVLAVFEGLSEDIDE